MACRLVVPYERIRWLLSEISAFKLTKCIWKYCLWNGAAFSRPRYVKHCWDYEPTKYTPYFALTGEPWEVCVRYLENRYPEISRVHCIAITKESTTEPRAYISRKSRQMSGKPSKIIVNWNLCWFFFSGWQHRKRQSFSLLTICQGNPLVTE